MNNHQDQFQIVHNSVQHNCYKLPNSMGSFYIADLLHLKLVYQSMHHQNPVTLSLTHFYKNFLKWCLCYQVLQLLVYFEQLLLDFGLLDIAHW